MAIPFKISVHETVENTVHLSQADVDSVEQWLLDRGYNPAECGEEDVLEAIEELFSEGDLDFFSLGKATESDRFTSCIKWGPFETHEVAEIFSGGENCDG